MGHKKKLLGLLSLSGTKRRADRRRSAPPKPSALAAVSGSLFFVGISWVDNSDNEAGFKIERKTGAGGSYTQIGTVTAGIESYIDHTATGPDVFYYRVRANNQYGDSAYSNVASATPEGAGMLTLDILADDTVTPAVVLIGGATITPVWRYSDGTSFSGLDGFSGAGKLVTAGMRLVLDPQGKPEEIKELNVPNDPFGFDLSALARFTGLTHFRGQAEANAIYTGSLSDIPSVTLLYLAGSGSTILGSISDLSAAATYINLNNTSSIITGSLADLPSTITTFNVHTTSSTITGGATPVPALGISGIFLQSTTMTQAQVDDVCLRLYTDRATFTHATPVLNIGGTNPNPSGIYQDATPPTTGLEYVFKLVNDPDVEGFSTWTITY